MAKSPASAVQCPYLSISSSVSLYKLHEDQAAGILLAFSQEMCSWKGRVAAAPLRKVIVLLRPEQVNEWKGDS